MSLGWRLLVVVSGRQRLHISLAVVERPKKTQRPWLWLRFLGRLSAHSAQHSLERSASKLVTFQPCLHVGQIQKYVNSAIPSGHVAPRTCRSCA